MFICKDSSNRIVPCSPNKIAISSTTTLRPGQRILPVGFQTDYIKNIKNIIQELDSIIFKNMVKEGVPFVIGLDSAKKIIDLIEKSLVMEFDFDWEALKSTMEFYSKNTGNIKEKNKIWCLVGLNRDISQKRTDAFGDEFYLNTPDTGKTDTEMARKTAIDIPSLILLRQNGSIEKGWRGHPFWWPIMIVPQKSLTMIYANKTIDVE